MYLAHHANRHFKGFFQEHTLSDIRTRFISHLFSGIMALVVMGAIFGIFLPQPSTAHASAALPATDSATHVPVLLLHGLEGYANEIYQSGAICSNPTNDPSLTFDRWDAFFQLNNAQFAGLHWGSDAAGHDLIHTIGYFNHDYGCSDPLSNYSECSNYPSANYGSSADVGTNYEDIRHIACRFYWYVYYFYTINRIPVNILAHSMGGIIAKWALSEAGHDPVYFPYPLLVYNVVTLSTPFQGIPTNFFGHFQHLAAGIACNQCFDALQLEYDGSGNPIPANSIIPALNGFTYTEGYWTVIGSKGNVPALTEFTSTWLGLVNTSFPTCDFVNVGSNLAVDDTVVNPGPSLAATAQVIDYDQCIFHEEDYPGVYASFPPPYSWPISTSYQDDASTYLDYSGWVGTPGNLGYTYRTLPHALAKAFEALGVTRGPDSYPPSPYLVYDVDGGGAFFTVWETTGGPAGPLSEPTGTWYPITGGQEQDFQGGSIYWSSATGTNEVQGAIHSEYVTVQGGPTGGLGFPTTNELGIASGRVSYFYGNLCGGRGPNNSGSAIYFSSTTGAHQVGGCIYNKYWNMSGPNSQLSFPTSDVLGIASGYVSYFSGNRCGGPGPNNSGSAIYSSGAGTYFVAGCIYNKYWNMGGPNSGLNFPTSDVTAISGGYVSYFYGWRCGGVANGPANSGTAIYSSAKGTFFTSGCIYGKYQQFGGPGGMLGFPVSDVTNLYNGGSFTGWVTYFAGQYCGSGGPAGSGSAIYTPATSNTLGASFEVQGCIYDKYQRFSGPNGLGYPITDEQNVYNGYGNVTGRENLFNGAGCNGTGSAIIWSGSLGAHEVHGCIYNAYVNFGGSSSQLGLPTTDEYTNAAGQRESDFQGGNIIWANGQAIINLNGSGCGPITPQC